MKRLFLLFGILFLCVTAHVLAQKSPDKQLDIDTHKSPTNAYECRASDLIVKNTDYTECSIQGNTITISGLKYHHNHRTGDPGMYTVWQKGNTRRAVITTAFHGNTVRIFSSKGWAMVIPNQSNKKDLLFGSDRAGTVFTIKDSKPDRKITVGEVKKSVPSARY